MKIKKCEKALKEARATIRAQKLEIDNLNDRIEWIRKDMLDLLDCVDAFIPHVEAIAQIYGSEGNQLHRKTT